ncbi:hypothetical protein EDB85DRAFT_2144037 [Lactarius pseudohatsudake]|nr:hypothetical protein EDB85DRAFT_2144037 [Lactarius pseudohatsudake]
MKLLGENETEAVLQRLYRLNHEEARIAAAQTLEVVYGFVKKMKVVTDGGKTTSEDIQQALVSMEKIASNMNKSQRDQLQESSDSGFLLQDGSVDQLQHRVQGLSR